MNLTVPVDASIGKPVTTAHHRRRRRRGASPGRACATGAGCATASRAARTSTSLSTSGPQLVGGGPGRALRRRERRQRSLAPAGRHDFATVLQTAPPPAGSATHGPCAGRTRRPPRSPSYVRVPARSARPTAARTTPTGCARTRRRCGRRASTTRAARPAWSCCRTRRTPPSAAARSSGAPAARCWVAQTFTPGGPLVAGHQHGRRPRSGRTGRLRHRRPRRPLRRAGRARPSRWSRRRASASTRRWRRGRVGGQRSRGAAATGRRSVSCQTSRGKLTRAPADAPPLREQGAPSRWWRWRLVRGGGTPRARRAGDEALSRRAIRRNHSQSPA